MTREYVSNDNDTIFVALWKELLFYGCYEAAVGLLRDAFRDIAKADAIADQKPSVKDLADESRRSLREDAMVMLHDSDGSKLKQWLELFGRPSESEFNAAALEWAYDAHDAGIFDPPNL